MAKRLDLAIEQDEVGVDRLLSLTRRLETFFKRGGASRSDAQDHTQDVLLRLLGAARSDQQHTSDAYVFTIARNLQRDQARRAAVRRHVCQDANLDDHHPVHAGHEVFDPERVLIGRREAERLVEGLSTLSDRTREIFLLHRLEGMSQREVATRLNISTSAVEKNVAKAMAHLVKRMGPRS